VELHNRVVVVTGGGNGIGRALCRRFKTEGAAAVVVADVDAASAAAVAGEIGGTAIPTDVSRESDVIRLVGRTIETHGRIDLFCSNAGIAIHGGEDTPNAEWQRCWDVNVMAHVYAARSALPGMVARGEGYFLQTVSAAGLLTHMHSATYAVSKSAALAFAEWLSINYGDRHQGVGALSARREDRHAEAVGNRYRPIPAGRRPGARAGGRRRRERPCRGALPHSAAPRSGGIRHAQSGRPRSVAARDETTRQQEPV